MKAHMHRTVPGIKSFGQKKRIHIDTTEPVLTDGKNFARTRCGNRLSNTPEKPTAREEPTEEALLYAPPPVSNKILLLPADLEEAPSLGHH